LDDGSKDSTWELIKTLHKEDSLFSGLSLSRNVGQQKSLFAGLMAVREHAWLIVFTAVWAIGAIQLLAIRIAGEYIGKTLKEAKKGRVKLWPKTC